MKSNLKYLSSKNEHILQINSHLPESKNRQCDCCQSHKYKQNIPKHKSANRFMRT